MIFVDNNNHYDASVNIALETYLVENRLVDEPILLFYINDPSIIIGRNQNTYEEINQRYVDEHNIQVVRRMSGGGAVYHDRGNFSFCFIKDDDGSFRDFASFTKPVIDALHKMGVEGAALKGRNDLVIGDQKFSGNAMYAKNGRMTAHGTILFDADLNEVNNALKPRKEKFESKGIKSVRSRVTNIKPFVDEEYKNLSTEEFRDRILLEIFGVETREEVPELKLTPEIWQGVMDLRAERMGNWNWNYGQSPDFDIQGSHKFPFGFVDLRLNVSKGVISQAKIYGDFFGLGEISDVEEALDGVKYDRQAMVDALSDLDLNKYLGDITAEELVDIVFQEA
ncbi:MULTISPECIES: lipoate--protein ligase [Aerococcus]|uniref:lipoate--protein ligase n=1 Tax=Aerococcus TaxID=1375 RepID=UPI0018A76F95|nr:MULTISPECIES: lipoate--protein ligase [Aerococcus]MCY3035467.1 lipoate--protein ligase [Aerococcus sp. Group 2]MCY3038889.1 lipoate--protein ligase [Aerococcus sp. Group 2]MCY3041044.1 lipoate--protein ligase [Aerococcus sp. Group 2]MCY3042282.1 lipoate--protein ligase [Aerococcus sp. Group 2]MDK6520397.1 lipoate--protein ligase [Aerococcus urinae]